MPESIEDYKTREIKDVDKDIRKLELELETLRWYRIELDKISSLEEADSLVNEFDKKQEFYLGEDSNVN